MFASSLNFGDDSAGDSYESWFPVHVALHLRCHEMNGQIFLKKIPWVRHYRSNFQLPVH